MVRPRERNSEPRAAVGELPQPHSPGRVAPTVKTPGEVFSCAPEALRSDGRRRSGGRTPAVWEMTGKWASQMEGAAELFQKLPAYACGIAMQRVEGLGKHYGWGRVPSRKLLCAVVARLLGRS